MTLARRPADATLSVAKAARLLGVHPNTIRAWSDQGRLRFYRINQRGDRRYRLGDLQQFLAEAESRPEPARGRRNLGGVPARPVAPSIGADVVELRTRPSARVPAGPTTVVRPIVASRAVQEAPARTRLDVAILAHLADLVAEDAAHDVVMRTAIDLLHDRAGHDLVAILEHRDGRLVTRAARGVGADRLGSLAESQGLPARALRAAGPVAETAQAGTDWLAGSGSLLGCRVAAAIRGGAGGAWGVLLVADEGGPAPRERAMFVAAVARALGVSVHADRLRGESAIQLHRAERLRRIAIDIGSKLDIDQILAGVVEHARVLFGAERAAVSLCRLDGRITAEASRGLSAGYLAAVRDLPMPSLPAEAAAELRPLFSVRYRDDPRAQAVRAAVVQEGFDTLCAAPLLDGDSLFGHLTIYHDRPHSWDPEELQTLAAFAAYAATAIKNAQNFTRMATRAAQLQSIQQLGAQLSRLTTEQEIGDAIANELETLIAFHNVRVYRLLDDGWLVPVAMRGLVGEFKDETPDLLRIRIGEGITGWVARHKVPQNLGDAAHDPRAVTIPGTDDDLDESMLLAPLVYGDQVLGVIVLSKLGLQQFSDDDMRLLVIYASLAAQAMANAETTDRLRAQSTQLERRLASQRALLAITESILGTFDARAILEQVADRLGALVPLDTISIELLDPETGTLRPVLARGAHAAAYLEPWEPGEEGLGTWVLAHGEPQLVRDELGDPRVRQFPTTGPLEGSLICVPLRGPDGALGVVSMERLGTEHRFDEDDFELAQLFVGQVSIALRNAEAFRIKEIEAQTDQVTGLLNAGAFRGWLGQPPGPDDSFGLLMLDLDNFKDVNETMGHEAGTELLRRIARTITDASRDSDRVFRYGGDEFAVIVSNPDPAGAMALAGRIRGALRALPVNWTGHGGRPPVSASIGVATYPADGATNAEILLAADRACFVAKRRGRDLIATAAEGLALAADFTLSEPTPLDPIAHAGPIAPMDPIAHADPRPVGPRSEHNEWQ
jgi:diguanylate cyclase (GGDEF)-like protein/excisionase family DNA binding protein